MVNLVITADRPSVNIHLSKWVPLYYIHDDDQICIMGVCLELKHWQNDDDDNDDGDDDDDDEKSQICPLSSHPLVPVRTLRSLYDL